METSKTRRKGRPFFKYLPRGGDDDDDARTRARRYGAEDEDYQSPSLLRCISLYDGGKQTRCVPTERDVSRDVPRSPANGNDSASVRFASSFVRLRSFIFIFLRTSFERGSFKADMHNMCMYKQYI